MLSNGWYTIEGFASYLDASCNSAGGFCQHASQPVVVNISNPIGFPDMLGTLGTTLPIKARSVETMAEWTVSIYSASNQLLRVYNGSTTNGVIEAFWDGKDTNGVQFTGPFVQLQVQAISTLGGLALPAVTMTNAAGLIVYVEIPIPDPEQGYMVSYQPLFEGFTQGEIDFQNMITQVAQFVASPGQYHLVGDGTGYSATTQIEDTLDSWSAWKTSVRNDAANVFYFGHGSPISIGTSANNPSQGVHLGNMMPFLENIVTNGVFVFARPYRFVFLDGCNTAKGTWCLAFGMVPFQVSASQYVSHGLKPRAFMGWNDVKFVSFAGRFLADHGNFVVNFFSRWSTQPLGVQDAANQSLPVGFSAPVFFGSTDLVWQP